MKPVPIKFFNTDAVVVAKKLLGKVIYANYKNIWLKAQIIETEAYYIHEKASHSSLGLTPSRKAMFMPAGTIYMYYCRGADTLNISVKGEGNAVLIKSGIVYGDDEKMISTMQKLNPLNGRVRSLDKLCSGQTLLCRSLNLKVKEWNEKQFDHEKFFIADVNYKPKKIITTTRLGIPKGRDEHLEYRFIDAEYLKYCTKPNSLQV